MKQLYCVLLAIILLMDVQSGFAQEEPPSKKAVAVYVTNNDDVDDGYKKIISNTIISSLTKSSSYRVLERMTEFLRAIQSDRDYNTSGEVKESQIASIGKQFGAKFVLVIDVSEVSDYLFIAARMINVETGTIVASTQDYTTGEASIPNVIAVSEKIAKGVIGNPSTYSQSGNGQASGSYAGESETFTVNGVTFEMVKVPGGSFQMGSYSQYSNEQPVHTEVVGTFYIGKTEVTQRLWSAVMGNNPSRFRGENMPVENVSWYDCQEFVERLSRLTGRIFRLPTEAEWEYAARGGQKSRGYEYSGSNDIYRVAWYTDNSGETTHPVAQKLDNELGIYDMSGNVWEWCSDSYSSSYSSPCNSSDRVLRGGSWHSNAVYCRVANRHNYSPGNRSGIFGLRLAL